MLTLTTLSLSTLLFPSSELSQRPPETPYPSLTILSPSRYTNIPCLTSVLTKVYKATTDLFCQLKQRNLREVAQLYGTEVSLEAIEKHRQTLGVCSLTTKCFNEARISALLIDDGLKLDKKHDIKWHGKHVPFVGRVLRIETLAEQVLHEECPDNSSWTLDSFTKAFVQRLNSYPFFNTLVMNVVTYYYFFIFVFLP